MCVHGAKDSLLNPIFPILPIPCHGIHDNTAFLNGHRTVMPDALLTAQIGDPARWIRRRMVQGG